MLVYASSMRARVEQMPERGETLAVMTETGLRTVLDGGRYFEAPRWHDGRLWFVDCSARTLLSISPSGGCQEHTSFADDTPCGLGILSARGADDVQQASAGVCGGEALSTLISRKSPSAQ